MILWIGRLALSAVSLASLGSVTTIQNDGMTVVWTENIYGEGHVYTIVGTPGPVEVTETATATPTPSVQERIRQRFGLYAEKALRIFSCETGHTFDPLSTGKAGERGLAQIHPIHVPWLASIGYSWDDMYIPEHNIEVAWIMSKGGTDWAHWSCN